MDKKLKATHEGKLKIGDVELNVAVLEDGTRIITQSAVFKAFGRTKRGRSKDDIRVLNRPAFIDAKNLQPFIDGDLDRVLITIEYVSKSGNDIEGYDASILPKLCKVYLDAREENKLVYQQLPLARASEILLVSLANVGITALVDEATGYQYDRERFELQKILSAYISDEILKWQITFTDEFYKEVYRLWKLPFIPKYIKNKPSFIGKITSTYVYDVLPKGIVDKLKEKTGKTKGGNWKYKWHQSLTPEVGREHLKKQITEVTTLMSISDTKEDFINLFKKKYKAELNNNQLEFDFSAEDDIQEVQELSEFDKSLKKAIEYNPKKQKGS